MRTPDPETRSAGQAETARGDRVGLERLIFFSDAVFAIAITLLALEVRLPPAQEPLASGELARTLVAMWPQYLGYGLSFLVIGMIWIGHHRKFRHIRRYDNGLLLLNLLLLMAVAFVPFPSSILIEYGNQAATIFYAVVIAITGILSTALWWYASHRNRLTDPDLDDGRRRGEIWGSLIVSGVFLVSIGLAFFDDTVARLSWTLIVAAVRFMH